MTDNLENETSAASTSSDNLGNALFSGRDLRAEDGEADSEESKESDKSAESTNESESESDGTQTEAESKPEGEQEAGEIIKEPEKIVTTQEEKDAEAASIRSIEHRKAKRLAEIEAAAKYEQELEKFKQQQVPQQPAQQAYVPPAPSPNHIWEPSLNQWIDPNMTVNDLMQLANQAQPQAGYNNQQPAAPQPSAQPQQSPANSPPKFTDEAQNQADECVVRIKDFEKVMTTAPISPEMANAASLDPQGLKNLYQMVQDAPAELYKILQLPVKEQERRMWMMNQKFADERTSKLKSKATPQPSPLNNEGEVSKDESSMGVSELKRKRHAKYWNEGG